MKKMPTENKKGFTLFELAVVLAVLTAITTAAIPFFIRQAEITAAQKTVGEISIIQDAARWYYLTNRAWPGSVQILQNAAFPAQFFPRTNPWGNAYTLSPNPRSLAVVTTVPNGMGGLLARALPGVSASVSASGYTVSSVIPPPGQEASISVVRDMANEALRTARESALPPYGSVVYVGQGRCPPGYVVIQTYQAGSEHAFCQKVAR